MTTLNFGDFSANMAEPVWFGFGAHFPGQLVLISSGPRRMVLQDPISGSTIAYSGFFDFSTQQSLLASRITGFEERTQSGALLMDWHGFSVTFRETADSPARVNALVMRGADTVTGGTGSDILRAYSGNDFVSGGEGNDDLRGEGGDDSLVGGAASDTLTGGAGNDTLNGGAGADQSSGGAGNDLYVVDTQSDTILEDSGGVDTVRSAVTFSLAASESIEHVMLTGSADLDATGNGLDNMLTGNAGVNRLAGGLGDDIYVVAAGDRIVERADAGTDLVRSSISHTLDANLENLTLIGAAISGTGNVLANVLTGNGADNTFTGKSGADTLEGGAGADTLIGGLGDDVYAVDAGDSVLEASGEGIDHVLSTRSYELGPAFENVTLTGNANARATGNELDNQLIGNSGNNVLDGRAGSDTMSGGAGNDTFVIDSLSDVVVGASAAISCAVR